MSDLRQYDHGLPDPDIKKRMKETMIPHKGSIKNNKKLNNMPSASPSPIEIGSSGAGKAQRYATTVYSESAQGEWQKILSDMHVRDLISPLHAQPHGQPYHVLITFEKGRR